ncbi:DEAD/DEAH box helicase [Candidatus Uhrbacteria bacterium]|nr:DEAD/DEAH box helicase [Candidatus Uhrbacteria bacterium]
MTPSNEISTETPSFEGLGIADNLLKAIASHKYTIPTPIQKASIPIAIEGKDMIGIAQTGTGKTLAFGIPLLQRISRVKKKGLVLLPTRELALQVNETLEKIGGSFGLRTAVLIGGASMHLQRKQLVRKPHVIVATPGRLNDFLNQKAVSLADIGFLVLDEADRMLDMGFAPQIEAILRYIPKERQTMLFSATMPKEIVSIANKHMHLPVRIEIAPQGTTAENVEQEMYFVRKEEKLSLLESLLKNQEGPILLFSRTKHGAKKIARSLRGMGHSAAEIHANRSQSQRVAALSGFKSGAHKILVATDIAARGIDVTGIALVLNFDLPGTPEDYVHRIGRTGRAGKGGKAISFATPDQAGDVKRIERLIRRPITTKQATGLKAQPASSFRDERPRSAPAYRHNRSARPPYRGGGRPAQGGMSHPPMQRRSSPPHGSHPPVTDLPTPSVQNGVRRIYLPE